MISRFTDSQIRAILRQSESGVSIPDLCREHSISLDTFYKWHSQYGNTNASMMNEVKMLRAENQRLKKMCAEEKLKAEISRETLEKELLKLS